MRLLVVSHSCVAPVNQHLYGEVHRRTGWEVDIIVPSNWRDEYGRACTVSKSPRFGGSFMGVPVRLPGNIILHTYKASFARIIKAHRPDAVYVHNEAYALATAQVYIGNVLAGRRPIGFYSAQNILKRYIPPFRWAESMVFRQSQFAFPVSSAVEDLVRRKGFRGPTTVLPLAVDTSTYCPVEQGASTSPSSAGMVGFVGRLVPEKGLLTLLRAMADSRDQSWTLMLIGSGPQEPELRARARTLGIERRVKFIGFIPHLDVPRYLAALDVLVLPSETRANWKEQFGRVLLESMACGTPVIGSDSGEIPALIHDTGGGLVFREGDAADLSEKIQMLLEDAGLRRRLVAAGAARVGERYSLPAVAEQFIRSIEAAACSSTMVQGLRRPAGAT